MKKLKIPLFSDNIFIYPENRSIEEIKSTLNYLKPVKYEDGKIHSYDSKL